MNLHFGPATEGELIIVTDGRPQLRREAMDVVENVKDSVLAALSSGMAHSDPAMPKDRYSIIESARNDMRKRYPENHGEQMEFDSGSEPFLKLC